MNSHLIDAVRIANKYLPSKKLAHSMRVAQYAMEDYNFYDYPMIDSVQDVFITALLHDIVEDTECTFKELLDQGIPQYIVTYLKSLTKYPEEDYNSYIKRCAAGHAMAVIVKRADIKDHLSLKETLTDKLKEKYISALPYLL